jgi:hypothetical protein
VRCRDATASSFIAKIHDEFLAHFHAVAVKRHSSMRNWLFGLPLRILCKQSPWYERKWWACSWLCFLPVSPFLVLVRLMLSSPNTCLIIAKVSLSHFSPDICTKFYDVPLSEQSQNCIRPDTRLQIEH